MDADWHGVYKDYCIKAAIEQEQSQTRLSFAEREQARPQVKGKG